MFSQKTKKYYPSRTKWPVILLGIVVVIVAMGYTSFRVLPHTPEGLADGAANAAAAQARANVQAAQATQNAAARAVKAAQEAAVRATDQAHQQHLVGVAATQQAVSAEATAVVVDQERSIAQTQVAYDRNVVATSTAVVVQRTQAANDALATIGSGFATATQRAYEKELTAVPLTATAEYRGHVETMAKIRVNVPLLILCVFLVIGLGALWVIVWRGKAPSLKNLEGEWGKRVGRLTRRVDGHDWRLDDHEARLHKLEGGSGQP